MSNEKSDEISALGVSSEFIEENKRANLVKPSKKFAPWTKEERIKRRAEVYKLHVEHGWPATRIADLMQVDKNTVYEDIKAIYAQIRRDARHLDFSNTYAKQMLRLEAQRVRLMDYLDKLGGNIEQKITVERLLTDIDTRILTSAEKVENSEYKTLAKSMEDLNDRMEEIGREERYITLDMALRISKESWPAMRKLLQKEGILKKPGDESL